MRNIAFKLHKYSQGIVIVHVLIGKMYTFQLVTQTACTVKIWTFVISVGLEHIGTDKCAEV